MSNKEIVLKWIAALRSGKYIQGKECLNKDDKFCCLGVLCDICGEYEWLPAFLHSPYLSVNSKIDNGCHSFLLPEELKEKLNISDKIQESLTMMNDEYGKTFEEIANYVEKKILPYQSD